MEDKEKLQRLEWLVDEVDSHFREATDALEKYLIDSSDDAQLSVCHKRIHQVCGSLEIADFTVPLQLAEEMERVVDALLVGSISQISETCQVLVGCFLQLSTYLSQVVHTGQENPIVLMLSMNDLRAIQEEPLVSLTEFFSPDLEAMQSEESVGKSLSSEAFSALLEKLRQMHQYALLRLIKREDVAQNLGYLEKAFVRLTQITQGSLKEPVWRASLAVLEGLSDGSIALGPAVAGLLRSLDSEILELLDHSYAALDKPTPQPLTNNLLFYVVVGNNDGKESRVLRKYCQLSETSNAYMLVAQGDPLLANVQLVKALSASFTTEFDQIKDFLERYILEGEDPELLVKTLGNVKKVTASLQLVGISYLQESAESLVQKLEAIIYDSKNINAQGSLMEIANHLVSIETGLYRSLNHHKDTVSLDQHDSAMVFDVASATLLREARHSLEQVKESIVEYISSQWQQEKLRGMPELLMEASGAFQLLNQPKVAVLLQACERFIRGDLLQAEENTGPAWEKMDVLAETITSIEYYLDFLDKHDAESAEEVLTAALLKMTALSEPEKDSQVTETVDELLENFDALTIKLATSEEADDGVDEEILEIFVEEALEVEQQLREHYPSWLADSKDWMPVKEVRRAFHTLKGSGRMVGAEVVADLAWSIENLLSKVIDKRVDNTATIMAVVELAIDEIKPLTKAFESRSAASNPKYISELIDTAEKLAKGEVVDLPSGQALETVEELGQIDPPVNSDSGEDDTLLDIFATEAKTHLNTIEEFVELQKHDAPLYTYPPGALQRALHTLKGSAKMAGVVVIAELVTPLEHFVKELFNHQIDVNEDVVQLLDDAVGHIRLTLECIQQRTSIDLSVTQQIVGRIEELKKQHLAELYDQGISTIKEAVSPDLLNSLMEKGMQQILDADELLEAWLNSNNADFLAGMQSELDGLTSAAEKASIEPLVVVSKLLKAAYAQVQSLELLADNTLVAAFKAGHGQLLDMIDTVAASLDVQPLDEDVTQLLNTVIAQQKSSLPELQFTVRPIAAFDAFDMADIDQEILEIFLVEADELSLEFDEALNGWQQEYESVAHIEKIKRILHTLKGGARMAGLVQVGDMSHELESDVLTLETQTSCLNSDVFSYLFQQQDGLNKVLAKVVELSQGATAKELIIEEPIGDEDEFEENLDDVISEEVFIAEVSQDAEVTQADVPIIERKTSSQEMIRVAAPVLDNLVNLAGESSISRGRIEQQVSQLHGALEDMEATIRRLQGQVRLLGIETEAQVMFRREQIEASNTVEGFDPLEMDRYSQLQQLSKSLLESSSDLLDLKGTVLNIARDSETQLLQQSRIQSDLQEGLMRARMVSFSHIVPRLRRIVRQLGADLNKQVKLNFSNIDGEMDRSVLEKMVAPLEHMIRNSMDHGIEVAAEREKAGKPSLGTITIGMIRRGGEVIVSITDDGRGLNIASIKQKAIKQEMMMADAELSDQEIAQFIFQAGFSTSENLTQVSGRGVGLDVVSSQVRQLGGMVELDTKVGQGVEFKVHLPFTVSVNRALMVRLGEDLFALPLNSIDGVVNISPQALENHYKNPEDTLEYGGEQYRVCYLGRLLSDDLQPKIDTTKAQASLVLIHSEKGHYAVHVDALLMSQEVVVKSLGDQFSTVAGLSGATILSDGRVVVILDLLELLRTYSALSLASTVVLVDHDDEEVSNSSVQTILVVDDSVTVRKVTSRFLVREGFNVLTATDGLEAIQLLQDHQPDLILLDIEMPRMDGFEVAQRVKTSQRWKDIPIIMVTSRTGEKHRVRAAELGVEGYVGKPYQEEQLLENMTELMVGISLD